MQAKPTCFVFLLFLSSAFINPSYAGHFSAGEIYYEWAPIPTDSNRYEVFVHYYRNTSGASIVQNTVSVCIRSSCFTQMTITANKILPPPGLASPNDQNGGWIVQGIDDCADPTDPNYKGLAIHKYSGFVSLPNPCGDIRFKVSAPCCRDLSTNMATNPHFFIEAGLNNTLGPSSSPKITSSPGMGLCIIGPNDSPFKFEQLAVDSDNDSVFMALTQPTGGVLCVDSAPLIPYSAGYSAINPFKGWQPVQINQQTDVLSIYPKQQGNYLMKIKVVNFRFDPLTLSWIDIGFSVREMSIPVTAACVNADRVGFSEIISDSIHSGTWFQTASIDSLKNAYNLSNIYSDTLVSYVGELLNQDCWSKYIRVEFNSPYQKNSIDPTDFRIYGPDSSILPVIGVLDSSTSLLYTDEIYLELLNPLLDSGNYLLQIRPGNDGNTLLGKCGRVVEPYSVSIIPVAACPSPSYNLSKVEVLDDQNIALQWTANAVLNQAAVADIFGGWDVYVRENQAPWALHHSVDSASARSYTLPFNGPYPVDHNQYEFYLDMRYGGKNWGSSNQGVQLLLSLDSIQAGISEDSLIFSWNDYNLIPAADRAYILEYGIYIRPDSIVWQNTSSVQTISNSARLNIVKPIVGSNIIVARLRAINQQNQQANSQSNWIPYSPIGIPVGLTEIKNPKWFVPNLILPNENDGNELFIIAYDEPTEMPDFGLKIFDTSGNLVFKAANYKALNNSSRAWNGHSANGQLMPQGLYIYLIEYQDKSGQKKVHSGRLSIVH
ncbi:MAG: gliding motility-associated C-terminal domain-containing protein [Bacteroidetes bacterium]|nr:gliding motility-associated C-terminal domain-containing protein [Bacteroidota bacterium]